MKTIKHVACVGLLALAGVSTASLADISIGALFPMSGTNAVYGDIFGSGVKLAVKHINEDEMLSSPLRVLFEDSQAMPQQGLIGMNKLVNVSKTPFVMSAFTGVSKAVSTVADRTKTVTVNGGGVGPDLAELGPYFWNIIPLVNFEVRAAIPYLVDELKLQRFVLIYVDDPLGASVREEMQEGLPKVGGELVESLSIPVAAQQFSGVAARVRAAKPDVVYIASYGSQQNQLIKQLRDNGVTQQIASYSAFGIPEIANLPEAQGALFTSQSIDWESNDAITKRFVDDYKKEYDSNPSSYTANYYNATLLFGQLAKKLEENEKKITGENLLNQRIESKSFNLVGGEITFLKNGTVVTPMQINEIGPDGNRVVKVIPIN